MDRETARQTIRSEWRRIIATMTGPAKQKVNGETSYICPLCGHGTHGDGLTINKASKSGTSLKCFGCGFSGDIIDLYQQTNKVDYNTALSLLAQEIRITIDTYTPDSMADFASRPQNDRAGGSTMPLNDGGNINVQKTNRTPENAVKTSTEGMADYTDYYRACRDRLNDPAAVSYLSERGISRATAAAYWLGYDPEADPAQSGHKSPRIIIPTCTTHYIGRSVDPNTPKQFAKMNNKGGTPAIFNARVLFDNDVQDVFVTEGAFDALSVIEVGAAAIALNSTSNADKLLTMLRERRTNATMVLCLDKDEAGRKAEDNLIQGFQRLNISYVSADICGEYKDPNEHLTGNREVFISAVQAAQLKISARPDNLAYYIDNLMAFEIERFKREIKTGFSNLDKLSGGLYSGLYVIAAISSLGKTTFSAQMADQIAAAGHDVLYFSMEQSRLEMVSKSIARRTYLNDPEKAVSSLSIRRGFLPKEVIEAADQYKQEVQDRISIIEGNLNCNISFIGEYIRNYIRRNPDSERPVVFIDYLQVLQPGQNNRQQTTKETIDSNVTELKRISRELDITVFVISSVNRANYLTPIDFESLKESGSIEYTADVIWGLQLQCLNEPIFDTANNIKERRERVKAAKAATPRKIELSCLKNRYGVSTYSAYFNYYPANDYFEPCSDAELEFTPQKKAGKTL